MNILERTAGNAFTRDPDYAKFTGRVVQTFTTTYYDPKEKVWIKRTVEYINVGKPDGVTPADSEEAMTPDMDFLSDERFEKGWDAAKQANRLRSAKYHAMMQRLIVAHLQSRGPMRCVDIARELNMSQTTVNKHLLNRVGSVYQRTGRIWGLVGIHDRDAA